MDHSQVKDASLRTGAPQDKRLCLELHHDDYMDSRGHGEGLSHALITRPQHVYVLEASCLSLNLVFLQWQATCHTAWRSTFQPKDPAPA
jgi:hypothetical protein